MDISERDLEPSKQPRLPQTTPQRLAEAEMKRREKFLRRRLEPEEWVTILEQFGAINEEQAAPMREGGPLLRLR